jgi:hypothetical protein
VVSGRIRNQRDQPVPVGAERIGEHIGVEPVVFVAGGALATTKRFDLAPRDHDDLQPSD